MSCLATSPMDGKEGGDIVTKRVSKTCIGLVKTNRLTLRSAEQSKTGQNEYYKK